MATNRPPKTPYGNWVLAYIPMPESIFERHEIQGVVDLMCLGNDHLGRPAIVCQLLRNGPGQTVIRLARVILGQSIPEHKGETTTHLSSVGVAELPVVWDLVGIIPGTSPSHAIYCWVDHEQDSDRDLPSSP
jgi:hypothetical protein